MKTQRKSGFELLRLIGIISVVMVHAGALVEGMETNAIGTRTICLLGVFGNLGVSFFVLISGYFGVRRDWKKIIRLELMVIFYSVCTSVLVRLVWPEDYPRSVILPLLEQSILPVVTRKHWYYTCYICIMIFSPYLNLLTEKLKKEEFRIMLIAGFVLFCVFPTFTRYEIMRDGGKGLVNMIFMYFLGRYIRLYADQKIPGRKGIPAIVMILLVMYLSTRVSVRTMMFALDFLNDNSVTVVAVAVLCLYMCKDLKFYSPSINRLAAHVFGIYILNVPVMNVLNKWWFQMDEVKAGGSLLPVWLLGIISATLLICFAVDILRETLLGKTENFLAEKIYGKLSRWSGLVKEKSVRS